MSSYQSSNEDDVKKINAIQIQLFDDLFHIFDPPLPKNVPERLEKIVAAAEIKPGATVLDVGSGTGILIPLIQNYQAGHVYACDLSQAMLSQLHKNHPTVETIAIDIRDLSLPDNSIDIVFINACYPNIVDKDRAFTNISRMMKPTGCLVISHPLGKVYIDELRDAMPFPLDDFPTKAEAELLFKPYGFNLKMLVDEAEFYVLVATKVTAN